MVENVPRFQKLLKEASVHTLDHVAQLEKADCNRLQLPYDLVTALQKHHKVWAFEKVDKKEDGSMDAIFASFEAKFLGKVKMAMDSGLQDVRASVEKSHTLLEAKIDGVRESVA